MKTTSIRILCLIGLGAALLMFVGDMCLYGHFGSGSDAISRLIITNESDTRIVIGGFIGPIAAILYCVGFFSVYLMIAPRSRMLAVVIAGGAAAMMVIGGAFHAMWSIRALLIKAGLSSGDYQAVYDQIKDYTLLLYNTMLTGAAVVSVLLLFAVLSGRSLYPRWSVVVNPGILLLLKPLAHFVPAPLGAIVSGGYLNLVFVVFFSVSILVTRSINDTLQTHGA
ncbi:MAG: DUF6796 family protein [Bacteroidales bacterium]|jgi:hypothetical protein